MSKQHKPKEEELTASSFQNLPDVEKNRILREIEAETPESRLANSRPLTAKERSDWEAFVRKAKRTRGEEKQVSVDHSLLKKVDAFAKRHARAQKLNRSE